jgi:hypothetical protein
MDSFIDELRRIYLRHPTLRAPVVRFRHRRLSPHDALVVSYPRSGSTWFRFMVFECLSGAPSEFSLVHPGIPAIGRHFYAPRLLPEGGRLIGSHETYCDRDRKVVYLVRDPRSLVLSGYSLQRRQQTFDGDLDDFVSEFVRGKASPFGSWAHHVSYWLSSVPARSGNLMLIRFEELRRDPHKVLAETFRFLDVPMKADVIGRAVENNTVKRMRAKEDRAPKEIFRRAKAHDIRFVNSGSVSGWKQELTSEQIDAIERHATVPLQRLGYAVGTR